MNANINTKLIIDGIKAATSIVCIPVVVVLCLKVFGIDVPFIKGNLLELSAAAASLAFISR